MEEYITGKYLATVNISDSHLVLIILWAFSRLLYGREVLVAFNVSDQPRNDFVIIDSVYHQKGEKLTYLYGNNGTVNILDSDGAGLFVQIPLSGHQFVILG